MKPLYVLLAAFLNTALLRAEEVIASAGGVSLTVPVPEGHRFMPESHRAFTDTQRMASAVGNRLVALFLRVEPGSDQYDLAHQCSVQVDPAAGDQSISKADFAAGRRSVEGQRLKLADQARRDTGSAAFTWEPVHDFGDRHFSSVNRASAVDGEEFLAVTTTALIKGKVWYLIVQTGGGNGESELDRLRTFAQSWVTSVIAANPSNEVTRQAEESPPEKSRLVYFIQVTLLGLIMLGFFLKFRRKIK